MRRTDSDNQEDTAGRRDAKALRKTPGGPIAIVGMHRSGTSMVAKLLQEAGLHLGDDTDLMPPAEENPEGFYEHLGFVTLNDEVLNAAGAGWDCPPPAGTDWASDAFAPFRERARLLAAPLAATGPWGWKDPRTSLTLPFWESAVGPMRTIVVVRNPLEVVTSLHRRNGFSIALGLTLWQTYAERILEDAAPDQRLITHFGAYFLTPERETARILEFSGLGHPAETSELPVTAVPALRHHQKTIRDLEVDGFPAEVIALYRRLCHEAGWWEGTAEDERPNEATVSSSFPSSRSAARGLGRVDLLRVENDILRRNAADREARIAEVETALANHEAARAELDGKVAERDSRLIERNALIARRDHVIAELQQHLARNASELSSLREQVADLSDRLAESERGLVISEIHERELRSMLTGLQTIQSGRDAEIMGTLGAVLSRHAPGAPASIYHRRLLGQVRQFVDENVPADARTLVATYGDDAMLHLGDRPTEPFPRAAPSISADYNDASEAEAIAQLETLRGEGAAFLIVPSPAMPWLSGQPELERYLNQRCVRVARERGIGAIYALGQQQKVMPA